MLTTAILLASVMSGVDAPRPIGASVTAEVMTAGTPHTEAPGKKRSRRRLPRPRSGIPAEEDDAPTDTSKETAGAGVVAPQGLSPSLSLSIRLRCPAASETPRHLLLHVLLI